MRLLGKKSFTTEKSRFLVSPKTCIQAILPVVLLMVAFACHFSLLLDHQSNPIDDAYSFRQTQTAINTYYIIEEGYTLAYKTPVLGAPWILPFEFPSYQFVVASVVKLFGLPLDQAGRLVSVVFFYLSLLAIAAIMLRLKFSVPQIALSLSLIVMSPLYTFWSSTFMIESTALFFALASVYWLLAYIDNKAKKFLLLGLVFSVLAALTKVTTFIAVGAGIGIYLLRLAWCEYHDAERDKGLTASLAFIPRFMVWMLLPLVVATAWTKYTDVLKSMSAYGDRISSSTPGMVRWNFGSLEQRLNPDTWHYIAEHFTRAIGEPLVFGMLLALGLASKRYRLTTMLMLFTAMYAPLLFVNLYFVHEYYAYASAICLLLAAGIGLAAVYESEQLRSAAIILASIMLFTMYWRYEDSYTEKIEASNASDRSLYYAINSHISKEGSVLIFGADSWSSLIPYYSQRKVIQDPGFNLPDHVLQQAIEDTGEEKMEGLLLCGKYKLSETIHNQYLMRFGLKKQAVYEDENCKFFARTEKPLNHSEEMIRENLALFEMAKGQQIMVTGDGLFVHAPSSLTLKIKRASKLNVIYGIRSGAASRTDGVCFEVILNDYIEKKRIAEDCITRQENNDEIRREFDIDFPELATGELIFKTICKSACDWDWGIWERVKVDSDSDTGKKHGYYDLLSTIADIHQLPVDNDGMFSHAPMSLDTEIDNVSNMEIIYGFRQGAADKTDGACFEVILEAESDSQVLAKDCIERQDTDDGVSRRFIINLPEPVSGKLVLRTDCIGLCDWTWSMWKSLMVSQGDIIEKPKRNLLSKLGDSQSLTVATDGLFAHAPMSLDTNIDNVSSMDITYGFRRGAADKTDGACFEVILEATSGSRELAKDCIERQETDDATSRTFTIRLAEPVSGKLLLRTTCMDSCDWTWSMWKSIMIGQETK